MNSPIDSLNQKIGLSQPSFKDRFYQFLFQSASRGYLSKIGSYFILGILYLMGAFHWAWLLNYGKIEIWFIDWQMFYDFYAVVQKAMAEQTIPYFTPQFYKGTNQFLAIPATDLSPTIFLLNFMSVEEFFLTQCLILYSLGFLGSLWLKKRFQWSLFVFAVFFLIFNLNGHIVSHMAIGHWLWISYFLFPFFILWVLRLAEGDLSLRHGTRLSWVLFGMLLLGGLHPFVWCLLFLGLLCLFRREYFKPVLVGVGLSLVFSAYRIIPAMINYTGYENTFASGFASIPEFLESMLSIKNYMAILGPVLGNMNKLGWWEVDHYIGVLGFGVILYFGIYLRRIKQEGWETGNYQVLDAPMAALTIVCFSYIYGVITNLPVPLITVERISSRFFIVPLLLLLTLSCTGMQQWFNRRKPSGNMILLFLSGIFLEGLVLLSHSFTWQVKILQSKLAAVPFVDPVSDWAKSVEGYYVPSVQISYAISLIALIAFIVGLIFFARKDRQQEA